MCGKEHRGIDVMAKFVAELKKWLKEMEKKIIFYLACYFFLTIILFFFLLSFVPDMFIVWRIVFFFIAIGLMSKVYGILKKHLL
jgi:hypothetical protein